PSVGSAARAEAGGRGMSVEKTLLAEAAKRILILDGAMGTMIQEYKLDEAGYRGARFDAWNREVRGNNDLLSLSQPKAVRDIHLAYFRAGADIVSTNTFSSTAIAQADYGMQDIAYELNFEGARLVRAAAITAETEARGIRVPIMISGTITDLSGRVLSGQTPAAFWHSIRHAMPFSVGLNCALGAKEMRAHVAELSRIAGTLVCAYPNAGLPNEFGLYDESPEYMAELLGEFASAGLVNIV